MPQKAAAFRGISLSKKPEPRWKFRLLKYSECFSGENLVKTGYSTENVKFSTYVLHIFKFIVANLSFTQFST